MHHRFNHKRKILVVVILLSGLAAFATSHGPATFGQQPQDRSRRGKIDFNRDIRPILSDKCYVCHGPDAEGKKIRLRLDSEAGAKADLGKGRRAIVPNHPERSEMIRRIRSDDEFERMPPVSSGRALTPGQIDLLTEWISQGADWQTHWAFNPPVRPALPEVRRKDLVRSQIDHFILARLEQAGLEFSPEADRATLIRRVSFDLTGLPPTPAEIDGFVMDKSSNAWEKVVDRLLASPRFGERMAFKWLDAARYADSNGYQIDGERSMWRWRDWVIDAFNSNMPFDRFTIEQLAGDLLPNATIDSRIATAFNRNHRTNSEDGIVPEEYRVEYVVDRVDTTSTVFLGLTMGCARCHNHKYDPLTHREYYQLFAYFNSIPEDGRASNYGNSPPWIVAPTRLQQRRLDSFNRRIAVAEREIDRLTGAFQRSRYLWESRLKGDSASHWFPTDDLLVHHSLDDGASLFLGRSNEAKKPEEKQTEEPGYRNGAPDYVSSPLGQGANFRGRSFFDAGRTADFNFRDRLKDYKDVFTISAWFRPESADSGAIVTHLQERIEEKENGLPKGRGYGLFFINGKLHFNLVSVWADDSFRVETEQSLKPDRWYHVIATFDSTQPYERVQIFLDGIKQPLKINNARLFRTFGDSRANLRIGGGGGAEYRFKGALDDVRIYTSLPDQERIAILSCADSIEKIASIPQVERTYAQQRKLVNAWFARGAPLAIQNAVKNLSTLKHQRSKLEAELPTLMVMQELPEPRPAYVLRRGAYDMPGEVVERGLPAVLMRGMSGEDDEARDRLGLARWIAGPDNPLTARVTVNRFWQMLFGTGLVKTVEDFGSQGELPSHPELLDWLAVQFREGGRDGRWNVKALLRTIVLSAAYRQSSVVTQRLQQVDPENRLLARGPRLRLSAEMIRDQALAISGLLVEKTGGPSVKPYQPAGLLKDMVFSNMTDYDQSKDDGLWRRSLYTFWKRTVMPPSMHVFDASSREFCTVRDNRTNTPLQALNLMNDVTYIEASRMLAQRMLTQAGLSAESRLEYAFRLATSRRPDRDELKVLIDHLDAQLEFYGQNKDAASNLLKQGEKRSISGLNQTQLAAYTVTASLILNLDETITKQ